MDRVCGARQRVRPREATPFEEAPTIMTRRPRLISRIRAVLVLVTALAAGRPESAAAFENGHELAKDCHVLKKRVVGIGQQIRIPNRKEALLCWGYIQAMQDLVMLTTPTIGSCPPKETTTLDLLNSFLRYVRSHPRVLKGNPAVAVLTALHNAYPCNHSDATRQKGPPTGMRKHDPAS